MTNIYQLWKYKYSLTVQNPPSTAGFQASFNLRFLPGMRLDFRDVRFADKHGNPLKHYRESYTAFSTAKFWVKLPANDSRIYMYYGNGNVQSASSGADVFDFWDDFAGTTINTALWTIGGSGGTVSNSILTLQHSSLSGYIESKNTFPLNSLVEIRAAHQSGQRGPLGFRNDSTQKAAAWQGAAGSLLTDHRFAHSGSSGDWDDDGVNRSGTAYNVYGVAHVLNSPRFYVNYAYRGTITTTPPGSGALPIEIYAYYGAGYVRADWVRVRKYAATEPVISLNKKYIQTQNGYLQQSDYFSDAAAVVVSTQSSVKDYFFDTVSIKVSSGFMIGQPDQITDNVSVSVSAVDGEIIERRELRDYSLISCEITKAISDAYTQLSAEFADDVVQGEGSTVKYYAHDALESARNFPIYTEDGYPIYTDDGFPVMTSEIPDEFPLYTADGYLVETDDGYPVYTDDYYSLPVYGTLLFVGKVISVTPSIHFLGNTAKMFAADQSRNLSVQKIPWNYQVISLAGAFSAWDLWISELIGTSKTGVRAGNIIDSGTPDRQFIFDPKTSRYDAIKKIAEYIGSILNIKIKEYIVDTHPVLSPTLYLVHAADIDQTYGGFDLPHPIEFVAPDPSIINDPEVAGEQDEKYNTVIVYGTITSTGETTVAAAYTPAVYEGLELPREYIVNDNSIEERESTAETEAIKWLLYFAAPRATVTMKFVNRFDLELYQRIRFGSGFQKELRNLTNSVQLPYVVAYDPRDEANSTHMIDVSGVPRPSWLRISRIVYRSSHMTETCEIKAISDYIYSSADPVVLAPYNQYIAPGYLKPMSDDTTSTVQSIVEDTVKKQLTPEVCTILSKDDVAGTAVVQTASGKLVTVRLS